MSDKAKLLTEIELRSHWVLLHALITSGAFSSKLVQNNLIFSSLFFFQFFFLNSCFFFLFFKNSFFMKHIWFNEFWLRTRWLKILFYVLILGLHDRVYKGWSPEIIQVANPSLGVTDLCPSLIMFDIFFLLRPLS